MRVTFPNDIANLTNQPAAEVRTDFAHYMTKEQWALNSAVLDDAYKSSRMNALLKTAANVALIAPDKLPPYIYDPAVKAAFGKETMSAITAEHQLRILRSFKQIYGNLDNCINVDSIVSAGKSLMLSDIKNTSAINVNLFNITRLAARLKVVNTDLDFGILFPVHIWDLILRAIREKIPMLNAHSLLVFLYDIKLIDQEILTQFDIVGDLGLNDQFLQRVISDATSSHDELMDILGMWSVVHAIQIENTPNSFKVLHTASSESIPPPLPGNLIYNVI